MTIRYRFVIESPWAACTHESDPVEFDEEPDEAELLACLQVEYSNSFPGYWERVDEGADR